MPLTLAYSGTLTLGRGSAGIWKCPGLAQPGPGNAPENPSNATALFTSAAKTGWRAMGKQHDAGRD